MGTRKLLTGVVLLAVAAVPGLPALRDSVSGPRPAATVAASTAGAPPVTTAAPGTATAPESSTATAPGSSTAPGGPTPTAQARAAASVDRVVAISVDGLNPRAITQLGPSGTPAFHRLMRQGAYTLNARSAQEQTRTLPNHTGMLTGRRIDDTRGGHGVTYNSDDGSQTVHASAGHYVASVFDVVHDRGGRTALFSTKTKFALYQRTWNSAGAADRVGSNQGRAKIDRFTVDTDDTQLVAKANAYLRDRPGTFMFLHIALPDEAGHEHGFMSKRYLAAVKDTDRLLGSVLDTIATRPALRRGTLVLLTADHGGNGDSHSDADKQQNYQVPFFAWGPDVAAGRNLYTLNPGRRSPGNARSTYAGLQPIRNGDVANLATDLLGLPKVPGSEFDADQLLTVSSR